MATEEIPGFWALTGRLVKAFEAHAKAIEEFNAEAIASGDNEAIRREFLRLRAKQDQASAHLHRGE